ncbi:TPA: Asp-tRNA(Asn)/Glu-tRNA(Gln) amidotransferase GatCAB subunit A [bacterium]|nr:Asp-tRNA(Asn)/Glu-tRNA(Gln) amidotransferase GatCAB subunit A [bacterium]
MKLYSLPAHKLHKMLISKEIKAEEIINSVIERIEEQEPKINAFITKTFDMALACAKKTDGLIAKNEPIHPLAGIPISIKDNICTEGIETTCASRILQGFIPPYDATVIKKLKECGTVIIGKTNMDEFAMGSSTERSYFGPTKNPHNPDYVPGGSSGGSCASVAYGGTICSLGSDTGGSIRQPASFCNVVGLKPTYGLVSRYGLIAFASSLDQIGPITKDVEDCAILLSVISGFDPYDSTSIEVDAIDYIKVLKPDVSKIKIGIIKEYFDGAEKDVVRCIMDVISQIEQEVVEISLPHAEYCIPTYYIIASSEASSNLARYDGVQYGLREEGESLLSMYKKTRSKGFGQEVKRRIMLGTYSLSAGYYDAYYLKAKKVQTLIKNDFDEAFKKIDLLISPTSPTPPFKIGEKIDDPILMYLSDILTVSINIAGIPAISIPCGKSNDGLPLGLQIIGPYFSEATILSFAYYIEKLAKSL